MAAATGLALTAGLGAYQAFKGAKQKREAEKALENYERQKLDNVANELSVYTKGAEMQTEELARQGATTSDALSRSGVRGVIGGAGRLTQAQGQQQRQISADLEQQQARIDQIRAQDAQAIRGIQEQREMQDIGALSSQFAQGEQMLAAGIGGVAESAVGLGGMLQERDLAEKAIASGINPFAGGSIGK